MVYFIISHKGAHGLTLPLHTVPVWRTKTNPPSFRANCNAIPHRLPAPSASLCEPACDSVLRKTAFIQRYSVRNGVLVRFMRDKATKQRGTLTSDQQDDARSLGSIPTDSSEVWLSSDPKLLTHRWDRQTDGYLKLTKRCVK